MLNDVSTQNVLEGRSVKLYYAVVLLLASVIDEWAKLREATVLSLTQMNM